LISVHGIVYQRFLNYIVLSTAESGGKKGGKKKGGSFQTVSALFRVKIWFHFTPCIKGVLDDSLSDYSLTNRRTWAN